MVSNGFELTENETRPLIGITAYGERARYGVWDHRTVLLPFTYPDSVIAGGGVPVLIPPLVAAAPAVDRLDAVVISGGPDVDPALYDAEPHPHTGRPRPERDAAEQEIIERALDRGIPVLAVCRGLQLLNVVLGGTLHQHLPDVVGHHGHNPTPGVFGEVEVALEPGSRVAAVLGTSVRGQCHHHQAVDQLGKDLEVTGRAADGTIEAAELAGRPFVVGVQWHPEQDDPRLFGALVAAARERTRT
ncbi:putative glutamine amidotransferase [Pseudonocardia thermophila]|uniref:Putative glutamine amidotransferase n=1 Tax=Pseudonocardia thermophila TaxID=1848 RepID=A0A1M6NLH4_PSETH|nr:putative glutamine amidotransferase [Pseudonocardia thermophila]